MRTLQIFTIFSLTVILVPITHAISPLALHTLQQSDEKVTIIDVRDTGSYRTCHIAGAISIPAAACSRKRLPALGRVVIYGDGLNTRSVVDAAAALNTHNGINAEILDGGIIGWHDARLPCTEKPGMKRETLPSVSFQQLEDVAPDNDNLVLVDLRTPQGGARSSAFTDLHDTFPDKRVVSSPFGQSGARSSSANDIYVLIDNGDGKAQETARRLRAAGIRRFVILVGGEETLRRRGSSSLITESE